MATLESLRTSHEQVEVFETAVYNHIAKRPKVHSKTVLHENTLARLLQGGRAAATRALSLTKDADSMRKDELARMTGPHTFNTFYERLNTLRAYHRKHPDVKASADLNLAVAEAESAPPPAFSGEEHMGRFMDLHSIHDAHNNVPGMARLDYSQFLEHIGQGAASFAAVPVAQKTQPYRRYVRSLLEYLRKFTARLRPLEVDAAQDAGLTQFRQAWDAGAAVPGWEGKTGSRQQAGKNAAANPVDLSSVALADLAKFKSAEEVRRGGGARVGRVCVWGGGQSAERHGGGTTYRHGVWVWVVRGMRSGSVRVLRHVHT